MVNCEVFPPSLSTTEDTLIVKNKVSWGIPWQARTLHSPLQEEAQVPSLVRVLRSETGITFSSKQITRVQ